MKKLVWVLSLGLVVAPALAAERAEAQIRVGPELGVADDHGFALGGRVALQLGRLFVADTEGGIANSLEGIVAFDWYFDCNECSFYEINTDIAIPIDLGRGIAPYFGGGINIAHISYDRDTPSLQTDTDLGLGLIAGLEFPISQIPLFIEGRIVLGGKSQSTLTFGLLWPVR
jgi:opacity protein-like surface antigen